MILAVGSLADPTFLQGLKALVRAGSPFDLVDIGHFSCVGTVDIPLGRIEDSTLSLGDRAMMLASYSSLLVRLPAISGAAPDERLRHRAEGLELALGRLFSTDVFRVMNAPLAGRSNQAKLYHAATLSRLAKVPMPRSCLTNDPRHAAAFLESCPNGAIYKGASSIKTWATTLDLARDRDRLSLLRSCPTLFQERIVGADVRVHVVGDRVFAEEITSADLDYRCSARNTYRPVTIPQGIMDASHIIAAEIGTPLLGIDYKIERATGTWFFLEANTMPCYEGYDRRAGGAISAAIADWLNG